MRDLARQANEVWLEKRGMATVHGGASTRENLLACLEADFNASQAQANRNSDSDNEGDSPRFGPAFEQVESSGPDVFSSRDRRSKTDGARMDGSETTDGVSSFFPEATKRPQAGRQSRSEWDHSLDNEVIVSKVLDRLAGWSHMGTYEPDDSASYHGKCFCQIVAARSNLLLGCPCPFQRRDDAGADVDAEPDNE